MTAPFDQGDGWTHYGWPVSADDRGWSATNPADGQELTAPTLKELLVEIDTARAFIDSTKEAA